MRSAEVSYHLYRSGKYTRRRFGHPISEYLGSRGARVTSNEFADPELPEPTGTLEDILALVQSGRRQTFERLDIDVPKGLLPYYLREADTIMALERVIIDARESKDLLRLTIFYPDVIWKEATYWHARARTHLHPNVLSESECERLAELTEFREWPDADRRLVEKAREYQDRRDASG